MVLAFAFNLWECLMEAQHGTSECKAKVCLLEYDCERGRDMCPRSILALRDTTQNILLSFYSGKSSEKTQVTREEFKVPGTHSLWQSIAGLLCFKHKKLSAGNLIKQVSCNFIMQEVPLAGSFCISYPCAFSSYYCYMLKTVPMNGRQK